MYNQGTDNPLAGPVGGVIIYRRAGWAVAGAITRHLVIAAIVAGIIAAVVR